MYLKAAPQSDYGDWMFKVTALPAAHGDCIWIEYGSSDSPEVILIDGGPRGSTQKFQDRLNHLKREGRTVRLLVVTHIDHDHIGGILEIHESGIAESMFDEIWFNGRTHLEKEEVFGGEEGRQLEQYLKDLDEWNSSFGTKAVKIDSGAALTVRELGNGLRVTLLSPGMDQLEKLRKPWDQGVASAEARKAVHKKPPADEEVFAPIGRRKRKRIDTAPPNGSSIAVMIEYEGKTAIFCADAHPGVLVESIEKVGLPESGTFDLVQLPHHGSDANVTPELLALLPAKNYVFSTDGVRHDHPSPESLRRMVGTLHCQGTTIWLTYPLSEKIKEAVPAVVGVLEFVDGKDNGAEIDLR